MYALYKLPQILLRPEIWLVGLLALAWWLARDARRLAAVRRLIAATLLLLLVLGSGAVRDILVGPLEGDRRVFATPLAPPYDAIVVVSGGRSSSQERMVRGIRLWREGVAPVLVVSGGIGNPFGMSLPEAVEMRELALGLGMPASAVVVESGSRTTSENAALVRARLPAARRIVLVSSAIHLRRATALFRREGFVVEPVASDPFSDPGWGYESFLPSASVIAYLREAVHEYVGIAVYGATGRLGPLEAPASR